MERKIKICPQGPRGREEQGVGGQGKDVALSENINGGAKGTRGQKVQTPVRQVSLPPKNKKGGEKRDPGKRGEKIRYHHQGKRKKEFEECQP